MAIAMQEQIKRRAEMAKTIDSTNTKIKGLLSDSTKLAGKPGKEKRVSEHTRQLKAQAADRQPRAACKRPSRRAFPTGERARGSSRRSAGARRTAEGAV
jgi:hypothetical protein